MEKTDIRRELRDSLELAVIRQDIALVCVLVPLILLPSGCAARGFRDPNFWIPAAAVTVLTVLPFLIHGLWVTLRIFRSTDCYTLYRAKLSQPHQCKWGRGAMYFTIVLEDPADGGKFIVNTRPIFASYGFIGPLLEDYINKTVTVAYNEETDVVVVIG